jgi:hypothetical protein
MAELLPDDHGHAHDSRIHHLARMAGTAHEERHGLEDLRERFQKALD